MDYVQPWGHRLGPSCHLISTLPGAEGTRELFAFAESIGLRRAWIQYIGTDKEHFDLFGERITRAKAAGATVLDRLAFVTAMRAKRAPVLT
jgi:hypothetical protein